MSNFPEALVAPRAPSAAASRFIPRPDHRAGIISTGGSTRHVPSARATPPREAIAAPVTHASSTSATKAQHPRSAHRILPAYQILRWLWDDHGLQDHLPVLLHGDQRSSRRTKTKVPSIPSRIQRRRPGRAHLSARPGAPPPAGQRAGPDVPPPSRPGQPRSPANRRPPAAGCDLVRARSDAGPGRRLQGRLEGQGKVIQRTDRPWGEARIGGGRAWWAAGPVLPVIRDQMLRTETGLSPHGRWGRQGLARALARRASRSGSPGLC
jgi:hypothetical protein